MTREPAVADLKRSLQAFLATVNVQPAADRFTPSSPVRDTPGARAAANATVNSQPGEPSPNTGQRDARRRQLPPDVAQAADTAERLLRQLDDLTDKAPTPGLLAARSAGGTARDLAGALRAARTP